jgi:hypothetical protein
MTTNRLKTLKYAPSIQIPSAQTLRVLLFLVLLPMLSNAQQWTADEIINTISSNSLKNHKLLLSKGYILERRNATESEYKLVDEQSGLISTAKLNPNTALFDFPQTVTAKKVTSDLKALNFVKTKEEINDLYISAVYEQKGVMLRITTYYMLGSRVEVSRNRTF